MKLEFEDGTSVVMNKETDTFFTAFNNNLILRESCYNCKYCGEERISDFTLADHWGIGENEVSAEEKWYGVSLVIANSQKAHEILKKINDNIEISTTNQEAAINNNRALIKPNNRPESRNYFFSIIDIVGFDKSVYTILKSYYRKAKIRKILYRIIGYNNYIKLMSNIRKKLN